MWDLNKSGLNKYGKGFSFLTQEFFAKNHFFRTQIEGSYPVDQQAFGVAKCTSLLHNRFFRRRCPCLGASSYIL